MTFGRPGFLWLLALALPVVALHFYRGRIRTLAVPTLLLWDRVLVVEEQRSALQRLRHLASLVVALAAIAALALALADPVIPGYTPVARRYAIVVDTSPELDALEADGALRREAALRSARDLLGRLGRRDSASIFDAAGLVLPSTRDAEARRGALDQIPRGLPALDPASLRRLVAAVDPGAEPLILTARRWDLPVISIGTPRPNAGILAIDARRTKEGAALEVEVRNATESASARTVELRLNGSKVAEAPVALGPRESKRLEVPIKAASGELLVEARLVPSDAIPADDLAAFVVPGRAPVPVLVVAEGDPDPHLASALQVLQATGEAVVGVAKPADLASARVPGAVVIFDRCDPPAPLVEGGYVLAGGAGPHAPVGSKGQADAPAVIGWDRSSPLNRWTGYGELHVKRSRILDGPPLLDTDRGAVAVAGRRAGLAWIQFGFSFRVAESDFALTPSFPIFLREASRWLADDGLRAFPRRAAAGGVLEPQAALPEGDLLVTEVEGEVGRTRTLRVQGAGARIPLTRSGLLRAEYAGRVEWIAVDGSAPIDPGPATAATPAAMPDPVPAWRDLPPAVPGAAAAGLLLLLEWLLLRRGRR